MSSLVVLPSFTVNPLFNLAYTVSKIEQKKKTTHLLSDKKQKNVRTSSILYAVYSRHFTGAGWHTTLHRLPRQTPDASADREESEKEKRRKKGPLFPYSPFFLLGYLSSDLQYER